MESTASCLNCGQAVQEEFCAHCGQKVSLGKDRKLKNLLGKLLSNLLFVDNRTWVTLRYLFFKPGQMSVEFLAGQRKKFLNPISLFLFINLIFFFYVPMRDYFLTLSDQVHSQQYSFLTIEMVRAKLKATGMDYKTYAAIYDAASPEISKLFMIMNIPFMVFILYPLFRKRLDFIYDRLIFCLHFFSFFLSLAILMNVIQSALPDSEFGNVMYIIVIVLSLAYILGYSYKCIAALGEKKIGVRIGLGFFLFASIFLSQFLYRGFNFLLTFWYT